MPYIKLRMATMPLKSSQVAVQTVKEDELEQLNGFNNQVRFQAEIYNPTQNIKLQAEI